MTLTDGQLTTIVTVIVGLVIALTNYLNHLSTSSKFEATNTKVDALGQAINGQAHQLTTATTELVRQAGLAEGQRSASTASPPIVVPPVVVQPNTPPTDPSAGGH